jgi:small subunit ribosomal protein S7
MARRHRAEKREVIADPKYDNALVSRFINMVMKDGKKTTAQKVVYAAMDTIRTETKEDPVMVFERAIDNVRPQLEVKSRRVGGATYQVPLEVNDRRGRALAIRWIINYSKNRKGVSMAKALASELTEAYNRSGAALKKRDDTHKMAQANRAFAHYRW